MNTYSHVAPEVSREADGMAQMLWQDDEDQADEDQADEDQADEDQADDEDGEPGKGR
jgi:hypothetical protein